MTTTGNHILSDEILARFQERAPVYDRENRFFSEDFEELRSSGYLTMAVPKDLGRQGTYQDARLRGSHCQSDGDSDLTPPSHSAPVNRFDSERRSSSWECVSTRLIRRKGNDVE